MNLHSNAELVGSYATASNIAKLIGSYRDSIISLVLPLHWEIMHKREILLVLALLRISLQSS